jgi:hypothetical protein
VDAIADEAAEKEKALQVAHEENVSDWIETIATWIDAQPIQAISLLELQRSLPISLIEIWLALLRVTMGWSNEERFTAVKFGLRQVESEDVIESALLNSGINQEGTRTFQISLEYLVLTVS